jgi:hypothetical protein
MADMGEQRMQTSQETVAERGGRLYRNLNLLAAIATESVAVLIPPLSVPFTALTGLNLVQAGGGEVVRRGARKRRLRPAAA